jgi:hypothetical protein
LTIKKKGFIIFKTKKNKKQTTKSKQPTFSNFHRYYQGFQKYVICKEEGSTEKQHLL